MWKDKWKIISYFKINLNNLKNYKKQIFPRFYCNLPKNHLFNIKISILLFANNFEHILTKFRWPELNYTKFFSQYVNEKVLKATCLKISMKKSIFVISSLAIMFSIIFFRHSLSLIYYFFISNWHKFYFRHG